MTNDNMNTPTPNEDTPVVKGEENITPETTDTVNNTVIGETPTDAPENGTAKTSESVPESFLKPTAHPSQKKHFSLPYVAMFTILGLVTGGVSGGIVGANVNSNTVSTATSNDNNNNTSGNSTTSEASYDTADYSTLIESKLSSVVTISVVATEENNSYSSLLGENNTTSSGIGSGVVIDVENGYIITNAHVVTLDGVSDSGTITVQASDGTVKDATLVGYDTTSDIAVIKVDDTDGLTAATIGDSDSLEVGDTTIAIGAPLELSGTVTTGIVSALNRSIELESSEVSSGESSLDISQYFSQNTSSTSTIALNVIQTDAAINSGNSGGALLDSDGNLIGINVAIASDSSTSTSTTGLGFAIPINYAYRIAETIIEDRTVEHGYLGISVSDYTETSDTAFTSGVSVESVEADSPADNAGLTKNDVITAVDDTPVTSATQFVAIIKQEEPGTTVTLTLKDGSTVDAVLTNSED